MALTAEEAARLDNENPTNQRTVIGTEVLSQQTIDTNSPRMIRFAITADASAGLAITVPSSMTIADVWVECTTANAGGTATVKNGATAITDAMIMAVDKTMVHAGTLDNTVTAITTATVLTVICNGAADRGIVTILGYPA